MPSLTKYSAASLKEDGYILHTTTAGNQQGARDGTGGSGTVNESVVISNATFSQVTFIADTGRGGGTHYYGRYFVCFPTSDLNAGSHTITSATLNIKKSSTTGTASNLICVKSNAFGGDGNTGLQASDKRAYTGYTANSSMASAVTDYSSVDSSFGGSSLNTYTSITLNATASNDILNNDVIIIMVVDYDYDYLNVVPSSSTFRNNYWYGDNQSGTSSDPFLSIDYEEVLSSGTIKLNSGLIQLNSGKIIL